MIKSVFKKKVVKNDGSIPALAISDFTIAFDGVEQPLSPDNRYYIPPGAVVSVEATIDGGSAINLPALKLVAEESADDKPIGVERYITGQITNGVIYAEATFPLSANYKVTQDRNNRAIDRMFEPEKAPFHLVFKTLDFLA